MKMSEAPKTVLFLTVDLIGHLYPCIAVAEQLVALGHRAIFAVEQSWKGKISCYPGIEEVYYVDPTRDSNTQANDKWTDNAKGMVQNFALEGIEKQKAANMTGFEKLLYSLLNVDDQLVKIVEQVKPNVIVVESFATVPAAYNSGIPWVRMCSGAALSYVGTDDLPPACSGLPTKGDPSEWKQYREISKSKSSEVSTRFHKKMLEEYNIPQPPPGKSGHMSPYLNLYAYPEEMDYLDIRPMPANFQRFDHFVRLNESDPNFKLPSQFLPNHGHGKLIYVSLGSVGSADLDLMKRFIEILSKSENRFIFSLGPHHEQLLPLLSSNMWGAKFVPQTNILPLVDLVITHGGNNSMLETLYFGKPMIVCPLFADQPENAQRLTEVGLGSRINAYKCKPEDLLNKMDELLQNQQLKERMQKLSTKMQQSKATQKAARAIIDVANRKK